MEQKVFVSRKAVLLEKDFPSYAQCGELLLEESSEAMPQPAVASSSMHVVPIENIPVLLRSAKVSQPLKRYGLLLEAMRSEMDSMISEMDSMISEIDSMSSNEVWTLVGPSKDFNPVECKWVYKHKLEANGKVTTFKVTLLAKGYI
ncbi:UNVERIFIED_CONTAM: hypothetical protein Sindi_1323000 [Sesamum indicum]